MQTTFARTPNDRALPRSRPTQSPIRAVALTLVGLATLSACSTISSVRQSDLEQKPHLLIVPISGGEIQVGRRSKVIATAGGEASATANPTTLRFYNPRADKGVDVDGALEDEDLIELLEKSLSIDPSVIFAEECSKLLAERAPLVRSVSVAAPVRLPACEDDYSSSNFVLSGDRHSNDWNYRAYRWSHSDGPPLARPTASGDGAPNWVLEAFVSYSAVDSAKAIMQIALRVVNADTGEVLAFCEPNPRSLSYYEMEDLTVANLEDTFRLDARKLAIRLMPFLGFTERE